MQLALNEYNLYVESVVSGGKSSLLKIYASILFYTVIPLPYVNGLDFQGVAHLAPFVGLVIGGILGLCDAGMNFLGMPVLTRSALVVSIWIAITGGLHLDGAMDTADGLAVGDPEAATRGDGR